jgi:crooked neck
VRKRDMDPPPAKKARVPKVAKVKNKMPAEVQITAEQLLQEASSTKVERVAQAPRVKITDPGELADRQRVKRKGFEDDIRKNRTKMTNWIKYAAWEENQREYDRARSVYERAIDVDHRNITVWLKYAEMEMRHKQVNHARNVWDRAVTILPRANQFWYKYSYMEEMLGNVPGARQVFERWMEWEPEEQAWNSYIKMELRYKELDRARGIYERFVQVHPEVRNWIRYARFEEQNGYRANARNIFERAVEYFGEDHMEERLFVAFAKFEEGCREYERARTIYKYALDLIPKKEAEDLFKAYTHFEKRFGDRAGIEDVIISKRKFQYEEEVKANSMNYDAWFDYIRLVETESMQEEVREVYERAIANVPPSQEKRFWRRYIYLWIYYALYEELVAKDVDRTRQVYRACLDIIPHREFTFAKVWIMYAHFEVRQKDLSAARKALGTAIGKCPKPKLFKAYIELELQLREFDRCRKLYEKYLEFNVANSSAWIKYAELETILGDTERARPIRKRDWKVKRSNFCTSFVSV